MENVKIILRKFNAHELRIMESYGLDSQSWRGLLLFVSPLIPIGTEVRNGSGGGQIISRIYPHFSSLT